MGVATRNPMVEPTATARIERNKRVRSSPRWPTRDMTDPSPGAADGGWSGSGCGVAGGPLTPASRRASASAMVAALDLG